MNIFSGAIASFASNLPEIAELVGNQPKYAGAFEVNYTYIVYTVLHVCLHNNKSIERC